MLSELAYIAMFLTGVLAEIIHSWFPKLLQANAGLQP